MTAEPEGPVRVPARVAEGLEAVRRSGEANMLARDIVAALADELGYPEAASWVREDRGRYARDVFYGAQVEGVPDA